MQTPGWLTQRGGNLKPNYDHVSWYVVVGDEPQYLLKPIPCGQTHGIEIMQTINGKRLDCKTTYPTADLALQGGLEELRKLLGW